MSAPLVGALAGAAIGIACYLLLTDSTRLNAYVAECRAHGGWAVHSYWPTYKSWIQCMKVEVISLPADEGAKP